MMRLRRLVILIIIFIFTAGASIQKTPSKTEIPDELWDELTRDLAQIQVLVDSTNQYLEHERKMLKVRAEPWTKPSDEFLKLHPIYNTSSFAVARITKAKIPTVAASEVIAKIIKLKECENKEACYFIESHETDLSRRRSSLRPMQLITDEKILAKAFGFDIAEEIDKEAVLSFLNYDKTIEDAYGKISNAIKNIQSKYKESLIYIEGFEVRLGIPFWVEVDFRFK